ncbi:hypothetical protein QJQ58_28355 [Paenibacillus dendritiformis]|uniref:hypothetical protein n=1 Tax=Paenibacillus dendritiformis TaxID=130049 RepID=UPI00248AC3F3|nr:hypothetical protein [Paenibacillus dendritiformis]WGU94356.1 hypothetical protein QJQ58_28355 [Paenibacillus dendritiformis]
MTRGQGRGGGDEGRKLQKCSIFRRFGDEKKKFLRRCINFVKKRGDRGGCGKNDVFLQDWRRVRLPQKTIL